MASSKLAGTWNKTLDSKLQNLGFTRLDSETCLYIFKDGKQICFLVVYVDDLLLAASSRPFMNTIKERLSGIFKMKDLGEATFLLGIKVKRDCPNRTISLSQSQYIDTVLLRCNMFDCNPSLTPFESNVKISSFPEDTEVLHEISINGKTVSYRTVVGSLMYAMMGTRPDIAYLVGVLGRYSASPKRAHWDMAKRGLRYLKGTRDLTLTYKGDNVNEEMDFHGYSDAD